MSAVPGAHEAVLGYLYLSLADIAELAHVQRPVVTVWRRRYASGERPFPQPCSMNGGSPRFAAEEIVTWIADRGLGNNPAFGADVAVRAALDAPLGAPPDVALAGLTALLRIKAYAPDLLARLSTDEVLDLADELDPEDEAVYSEVEALGEHLAPFCRLADLVAGAAYTPGAAVEALLADRFRSGRQDLARSALSTSGLALVADVAGGLVGDSSPGAIVDGAVHDPYPGCGDLLVAVLGRGEMLDVPTAVVPTGEGHRLARRRLGAHGWEVRTHGRPDAPASESPLVVTQIPPVGTGRMDDTAVLTLVDEVLLALVPGQRALVLGPASALVDASSSAEAESARAAMLRSDRLRAAVLLPAGLVVERPRERLALWVLGDAHPDVPIRERWTMVADLSAAAPVEGRFPRDVVGDLVTDVVAALGTPDDVARHAFRFARFVRTSDVLASRGGLAAAARPVVRGARDDGGASVVRAGELLAALDDAAPPPLRLRLERGEAQPERRLPVGDLIGRRALRHLPGNRLDAADIRAAGSEPAAETRVVGVPELCGDAETGSRAVDRFGFATRYPSGRLTEPGDVVFCTTPRPAALVDVEGFSVVEFPAQVLRLRSREPGHAPGAVGKEGRVVPEALAKDIAAQDRGSRWRSWEVRVVPTEEADDLAAALDDVRARQAHARRGLAVLEELATTLVDGVSSGVVRMRKDEPGS
jgi:predicted DNA-binding transcriptional regulator AlpA